jgi:type IV secretory pathway TrbF-like protein
VTVRLPWTRTSASKTAGDRDAAGGPYRTRYDIAREGYEVRIGQLSRALDQAALKVYLAVAANLVLGIGIVMIALRGGVRPIFIPYDSFGRVIQYDQLSRFNEAPRGMVEAELARWLVSVRGIYYGDPIAQLDRGRAAKAFLTPEAEQWLEQYYAVPSQNPALLLRDLQRTAKIVSISKDPDRNLWYLQWKELDVPARGPYVESAWQGTLKVDFAPGRTEDEVWANPTGIRIASIEWNRLREVVSDPRAASSQPIAPPPGAAAPSPLPGPPPAR